MRVLGLLLVALLLPPLAAAAPAEAVFLAWHLHPDPRAGTPEADPFSSPSAPLPPGLADADGPLRLPATRFDGVLRSGEAPGGDPSSVLARFTEARDHVLLRQRSAPAPLAILLTVGVSGGNLSVSAALLPETNLSGLALEARLAVYEDGVPDPVTGRAYRFVVRATPEPEPVDLSQVARLARTIPLDPAWDPSRVGVALWVASKADQQGVRSGEVLQAASWRSGQEGSTRQQEKAVLVEHASATWCDACRPADEAVVLLASQFGADAFDAGPATYPVQATPLALAGLAGGALLGIVLVRRRAR